MHAFREHTRILTRLFLKLHCQSCLVHRHRHHHSSSSSSFKNRLTKEVAYYKKEALDNERTLQEMKEDTTKDSYDIKRFQEVLNESYMMIPDSTKRLQQTANDLAEFLSQQQQQQQQGDEALDPTGEWYRTAQDFLKEHQAAASSEKSDKQDITPETTNVDDLAPDEAF
jgi:tubulin-specific chaperone A